MIVGLSGGPGLSGVVDGRSVRCLLATNGVVRKQMFTSGVHQRDGAGGFSWSSVLAGVFQDLCSRAFPLLRSKRIRRGTMW